jgi:chorismate mutase
LFSKYKIEAGAEMTDQELAIFRARIDAIDDEIVVLLAKRFGVAGQVAAYKRERGIEVRLQDRISEVLDRVADKASKNGIEAEAVRAIYQTIIETTCRFEEARIGKSVYRSV